MNMRTSLARVGTCMVMLTLIATPPLTAQVKESAKKAATKTATAVTDGWITMKVHAQFVPEKALANSDIDVDTKNGVVTLNGTVASAGGRARAVAIAKATDGVKSVTDNLTIAAAPAGAMSDGWIKAKIYGGFVTEKALDKSDIDVDVANSVVTLEGTVPSEAARSRAMAIAKGTEGVKSVKDALKVSVP